MMFDMKPYRQQSGEMDLFERMYQSFNDMMTREMTPLFREGLGSFKMDVKETEEAYLVEADLPGFQKEDIAIDVSNDYLTIQAKRNESREEKDKEGKVIRKERHAGQLMRRFYVSQIEEDGIEAKLEDGVLRIRLPKAKEIESKAKRIEIQ